MLKQSAVLKLKKTIHDWWYMSPKDTIQNFSGCMLPLVCPQIYSWPKKPLCIAAFLTITRHPIHLMCVQKWAQPTVAFGLCIIRLLVINEVIFGIGNPLTHAFFLCWLVGKDCQSKRWGCPADSLHSGLMGELQQMFWVSIKTPATLPCVVY